MAEEAADLSAGQHAAGVRVFVPGHHLDAQSLQLGRVESPEDAGNHRERALRVGVARSLPLKTRLQSRALPGPGRWCPGPGSAVAQRVGNEPDTRRSTVKI